MEIIDGTRVAIHYIAGEVYEYGLWLADFDPEEITEPGCDEPGGDIRLRVHNGAWHIHTGDASYDQDHRGCWGSSWVPQRCTKALAVEIAKDLIEQAAEMDDS